MAKLTDSLVPPARRARRCGVRRGAVAVRSVRRRTSKRANGAGVGNDIEARDAGEAKVQAVSFDAAYCESVWRAVPESSKGQRAGPRLGYGAGVE